MADAGTTPRREHHRLSSADAAWLHMDRPTNLMVVNSVLVFDQPLSIDRLRDVVGRRMVEPYPRFRQRVVESRLPARGPAWETMPDFDLDHHIHRIGLPAAGDEAALQELVGDLASEPLDRCKPLWDVYLIEGLGPGCALLFRLHHCIADGIALARVLLTLTDAAPDREDLFEPPREHRDGRLARVPVVGGPASTAVSATRSVASALMHEGFESLLHPRHAVELTETVVRDAAALARLTFLPSDSATAFRGELHAARSVSWTAPMDLQQIKAIAHGQGATVNDVLLCAVSGALRRFLQSRGEEPRPVRAIVPFNLRPLDQPVPRELGNRFGLVFLELPVHLSSRRERLAEVKRGMARIKSSPDGPVSYGVLSAIGLAPLEVESRVVSLFSAKGTAVMTNVPGPREPVFFAGAPVRTVLIWAPTSGSVGMSVSIFSYDGRITVGLLVHSQVIPDPERIVGRVGRELSAIGRLAAGGAAA